MSRPLRCLVVDDDEDDVLILEYLFGDAFGEGEVELVSAPNVDEGLAVLEVERFDLCFVDYRLGRDSGLDFLERRSETCLEVPIVLLSGQADLAPAALAAGATRCVEKTAMSVERLRELVGALVGATRFSDAVGADKRTAYHRPGSGRTPTSMSARHRSTILVAEDDPEDRELAREAFEAASLDAQVRFVESAEALLDYLHQRGPFEDPSMAPRPAFILLDLHLPGLDGHQALQHLKSDPDLRRIPVVVMTSSEAPADVEDAYRLGASGYVTKRSNHGSMAEALSVMGDYWLGVVRLPADATRH